MAEKILISGNGTSIKDRVRKITQRINCEYRTEIGNCLKIGGFCMAVDDIYCPKSNDKEIIS